MSRVHILYSAMTAGIQGFHQRLRHAKRTYELENDCDLGLAEISIRVARIAGVKKRDTTAVGRWLKTARPGTWEEMEALAIVLEVSPGWLAFGEGKMMKQKRRPRLTRQDIDELTELIDTIDDDEMEDDDRRAEGQ